MRPAARRVVMLALLERAWDQYPDQRLGQLIGNAGRVPSSVGLGEYRDPFNVEDDEMWDGLRRLADGKMAE